MPNCKRFKTCKNLCDAMSTLTIRTTFLKEKVNRSKASIQAHPR